MNVVEASGHNWSRRKFLKVTGGAAFLSGLFPLAGAENAHTKISDIQTMTLSGQRTYVYGQGGRRQWALRNR